MNLLRAILSGGWPGSAAGRRRAAWIAAVLAVAGHAAYIGIKRQTNISDFDGMRELGRHFLAGEDIYEGGGTQFVYMPSAALYHAPLAMLPSPAAFAVRYAAALVCLWLTLRWLAEMALPADADPPGADPRLKVGLLTLLLGSQYVIRDMDDGGGHLILLAMLVGGVRCLQLGRPALAALWWGLATSVKVTPALLIPFLLWKRQWRAAGLTAAAAAAWTAAPALYMGPADWWRAQSQFNTIAASVLTGTRNPLREENELRPQNQSLRPAVLRLLVDYPPGHPMHPDSPAYVTLGRMEPAHAETAAKIVTAALLVLCAWRSRRPYGPSGAADPAWPTEAAGVLVLMLLLSPVTWLQHLVFALPALYLIQARRRLAGLPAGATALMWVYVVLALVLNREFLGRIGSLVVLSWHVHTLAMLILLGLMLWLRPGAGWSRAGVPRVD